MFSSPLVTGKALGYSLGNRNFVRCRHCLFLEQEKTSNIQSPSILQGILILTSLLSLLYHIQKTLLLMSNHNFGLLRQHLSNGPWTIYVSVQLFEGKIFRCCACLGSRVHISISFCRSLYAV